MLNNLVVGGAQSSARRLLGALSSRGLCVRALVVEERAAAPSPGRIFLEAHGVPVDVTSSAREVSADVVRGDALAHLDHAAPRNVFFWNLRPTLRVALADALVGLRVVDVSPGAMSFDALDRFFGEPPRGRGAYLDARDYGRTLHAAVVKYGAERLRAEETLGCSVHVIPNGVDLPAEPVPLWRPFVVGTAARLSPDKRLDQLIDAVRLAAPRLPGLSVRVAGGDDPGHEAFARALRDSASDLPIVFVGDVPDIASFHAGLSAFVAIAEPEGCPNASLAAMAAGLPVVMTDAGGASDQLTDGETGLLVPRGDVRALADAIVRLGRDRTLGEHLGAAARAEAGRRFSLSRMAEAYQALLAGEGADAVRGRARALSG